MPKIPGCASWFRNGGKVKMFRNISDPHEIHPKTPLFQQETSITTKLLRLKTQYENKTWWEGPWLERVVAFFWRYA
jgi:hypothetical protein